MVRGSMRNMLIGSLMVVGLLIANTKAQQNWPSFRGDSAKGIAEGFTPVIEWDMETSENVLWKTPIPVLGHSSPIIWGDRIYVTTALSDKGPQALRVGLYGDGRSASEDGEFKWLVYCVDKNTGKILWNKIAYTGKPKIKRHPKNSHATPTPCTDGKHVVVRHWIDRSFAEARALAAQLRDHPNTLTLLAVTEPNGVRLVCSRSDDLSGVDANRVLCEVAGALGGRGGGQPTLAQGGTPLHPPEVVVAALAQAIEHLKG